MSYREGHDAADQFTTYLWRWGLLIASFMLILVFGLFILNQHQWYQAREIRQNEFLACVKAGKSYVRTPPDIRSSSDGTSNYGSVWVCQ